MRLLGQKQIQIHLFILNNNAQKRNYTQTSKVYLLKVEKSYIFFWPNKCNRECFIQHYNNARCGVAFGVDGHEMCVRKNILNKQHTFMDSNSVGDDGSNSKPITLNNVDAVYNFIVVDKGWTQDYLDKNKDVRRFHFI